MARNSSVKADAHAPAVTERLARFVTGHPSRGGCDAVDREAHRTFANRVGCAIGPSHHETVQAAIDAVQELQTDWREISEGLGQRWELALNTYKPFACGIVIHPAIHGCVQLRDAHGLVADDIEQVTLRAHSLVLELTVSTPPATGLESKFSVDRSCAVGLLYGRAGEHECTDEVVNRPEVLALRAKFDGLVAPVLGADKAAHAWGLSMDIAQCANLRDFIACVT